MKLPWLGTDWLESEVRTMTLFFAFKRWSTFTSPWLRCVDCGEVARKLREVAVGEPTLSAGNSDWNFSAVGSSRLVGMILFANGVSVTTPFAPRTRVAGS